MIVFAQATTGAPDGVLVGGWFYIYAAYGITWATFALYGATLVLRDRLASREADR